MVGIYEVLGKFTNQTVVLSNRGLVERSRRMAAVSVLQIWHRVCAAETNAAASNEMTEYILLRIWQIDSSGERMCRI